jgi:hypothetical protein
MFSKKRKVEKKVNLEQKNLKSKNVKFGKAPHVEGSVQIWTYEQFRKWALEFTPNDFLVKETFYWNWINKENLHQGDLTFLASFLEKYLDDERNKEEVGLGHLKELLNLMSEDLEKYQPNFWERIKTSLTSKESNGMNREFTNYVAREKEIEDRYATKENNLSNKKLTLEESLNHSIPTKQKDKVKCKECKEIFVKRYFYAHYKKHLN